MSNQSDITAKEQVLAWVRSKNPHAVRKWKQHLCGKLYGCHCKPEDLVDIETPSDMGLQELLIACGKTVKNWKDCSLDVGISSSYSSGANYVFWLPDGSSHSIYDLTKNLHNQSEEFYQSILPLINDWHYRTATKNWNRDFHIFPERENVIFWKRNLLLCLPTTPLTHQWLTHLKRWHYSQSLFFY